MTEHKYWEHPFLRRWRAQNPQDVTEATVDDVRKHYEAKGYEVRIVEDAKVEIHKPNRPWHDAGYVDEYQNLFGEAAEWERRRKMINLVKQRRLRNKKRRAAL